MAVIQCCRSQVMVDTAPKNARSLLGSLMPGALSTPDDTSTAYGRTASTAAATFSGVSPPARTIGRRLAAAAGERPVDRRPGAAASRPDHAASSSTVIDRRERVERRRIESVADRNGLDHRSHQRLRELPPTHCRAAARRRAARRRRLAHLLGALIDEHSDAHDCAAAALRRSRRAHCGCDETRALRPEDEPDGRRAEIRRQQCILDACDAADLDPRGHDALNSRSAAPGSGCAIKRSPTRNAS